MAGTLGTIRGQMVLDVKQAIASYTAARLAHLQTVTALRTGAGAMIASGAGIAAVGVALLAGLKVAADAAAEFERRLDFAGAVTDATASQMEALRVKALQLGQDTIFSANQIADSFVELAKAGVSVDDIVAGIGEAVTNLGAAADIPLDTAANIIMSAVQTFGLSATQAVEVADLLAGAANASIVEVEDLGVSLKYVGGVASALGLSIGETTDAIALLGTYGIRGSTAGTSLRQILVSLTGATGPATAALKDLGIITEDGTNAFFDSAGSVKPLAEVFQILQDATAGLTDEQKVATLRTIFQNRALAAALDLTKAGADGFAAMNEEIGKTTAMEVASARLDNLSGDIEILRGNMETLMITQGSTIQEFLRGLVQGVTSVIQWFTNLSTGTQENIIKLVAITAVVLTIVGAFGMFAGAIMNMVALGIQLRDAFLLLKNSTIAMSIAQWAMNSALLASPITWVVVAIMALVAAFVYLWNNNEGFRNFWIGLWEDIVNVFNNVVEWFKTIPAWWNQLWADVGQAVSDIWAGIISFFQAIPGKIMEFFYNWTLIGLLISHWDSIRNTIVSVWTGILAWFQALPGRIATFFSELPGKIGYWIGFMIGTVLRLLLDFNTWVWGHITTGWNAVVTFFSELPGRISLFFQQLWANVVAWVTQLAIDSVIWVLRTRDDIIKFFSELPGKVSQFFQELWQSVVTWMQDTYRSAVQKATDLVNGVISWFQQLPGRVTTFFTEIYTNIVNKLTEAKNKALEIATNIFTGVRDAIQGLPGVVSGIIQNVIQAVKDKITEAFNAVKDFGEGLWEGFKDGLGIHSPSYIERAMWQIMDVVTDETASLKDNVRQLQGLGNNINDLGSNMGSNFGSSLDAGLVQLQNQVAAAKKYQAELSALSASSEIVFSGTNSTGVPVNSAAQLLPGVESSGPKTTTIEATINVAADDLDSVAKILDLFEQLPTLVRAE